MIPQLQIQVRDEWYVIKFFETAYLERGVVCNILGGARRTTVKQWPNQCALILIFGIRSPGRCIPLQTRRRYMLSP